MRVTANLLTENLEMQKVCRKVGFRLERMLEENMVKAEIELN